MTDEARASGPHKDSARAAPEPADVAGPHDSGTAWGRSGEELPRNLGAGLESILSGQPRVALWAEALLSVAGLAILDYLTGVGINLSILYLVPVIFATWFISQHAGAFIAILSVVTWATLDSIGGVPYGPAIVTWNALVRLGLFVIVLWLVHTMKESRVREAALARTDSLTGVANGRSFSDRARFELASMRRNHTPLTMAYLDLDRFKHINDTLGHAEGDRLLREVAGAIRSRLRATDMVARLGGDEFGVLFPGTDRAAAPAVLEALREAVSETVDGSWDVSCTIGAVTFDMAPESVDFMVRSADELMYRGKRAGRGSIEHSVWPGVLVGHADDEGQMTC